MNAEASAQKVWVYKYDGSLQCGMGEPATLESMQDQLGQITVFAAEKRNDGMMRTQVCGSNTGEANVYLINQAELEKAKELGFEEWTF